MTGANRDLVGLSRQVLYEFEMVEALAKRLTDLNLAAAQPSCSDRFKTSDASLVRDWFECNAMLESLLIHVRGLIQFLFDARPPARPSTSRRGRPRKLRDGFAEDYFAEPREWRRAGGYSVSDPPRRRARDGGVCGQGPSACAVRVRSLPERRPGFGRLRPEGLSEPAD